MTQQLSPGQAAALEHIKLHAAAIHAMDGPTALQFWGDNIATIASVAASHIGADVVQTLLSSIRVVEAQ